MSDSSVKKPVPLVRGLSGKLLVLTALFVLIAEVLIFIPSVANFRVTWLEDRIATASIVGLIVSQQDMPALSSMLQEDVLMATGTKGIAIRAGEASTLLTVSELPEQIDATVDLRTINWIKAVQGAFSTLFGQGERILRVIGDLGDMEGSVEVVTHEKPLQAAMREYARNVAFLSVLISLFTAFMVYLVISRLMITPIRGMTRSMLAFAAEPENTRHVIQPSLRNDELGLAEGELAAMQTQLQKTLKEKKRLADLGLAVSKINHDMRNILASAQLVSDSFSGSEDPMIKRFAPRLVKALDRAVNYSEQVLSYGSAKETSTNLGMCDLKDLLADVAENLDLDLKDSEVEIRNLVPEDVTITADREQLFRAMHNISRNAVEAMANAAPLGVNHFLEFSYHQQDGAKDAIRIRDSGPGLPERAQSNLFEPFRGGVRAGGTGLGLSIAREIVLAHGGELTLTETKPGCTIFEILLPKTMKN